MRLRDHALSLHAPDRVLRDAEQLSDTANELVPLQAQGLEPPPQRAKVMAVSVARQPHGTVARQDDQLGPAAAAA